MELRLENISFRYNTRYLFKDFNVKFNNGLSFVIGNNNSGKSTLFKIISGLLPYNGNIYVDSKDIKRCKNVIFLGDNYVKSLKGNVSKYLLNIDEKIIEFMDIGDYLNSEFRKLTIDIRIKICIAKFISDMDVIVIDNMLCWLNKNDRNKILKKLKVLGKKKIIVIIDNNMENLIYANRILLLDKGFVVMDNTRDDFFLNKDKLEKYKVSLPFLVDLSYNLKFYNIVDDIYYDIRELVDAIWK